ncbi:hypothetical protein FRC01_010047, partial [Tulasnella sp. 417]
MNGQPAPTFALAPFDAHSPGDCILRSCDGIHFKVIRQFLITASTVFADMFTVGNSPADEGSLPIVALEENANTLRALLTMLYPTDIPKSLDHAVMLSVVQAYDKYLIPEVRLRLFARELWQSPAILSVAPAK